MKTVRSIVSSLGGILSLTIAAWIVAFIAAGYLTIRGGQ